MKVGDKIFGFRFDIDNESPVWVDAMEEYVDRIGEIEDILSDRICIRFDDGDSYVYWWYPIPDNQTNELLDMLKRAHEELDCAEFRLHEGVSELLGEMEVLIKKVEER